MPLNLKDPRWSELPGSYGHSTDVVRWLAEAQDAGSLSDERLGDLVNEVAHQGDASLALYAVVPYFVEFAKGADTENALALLTHAGLLCADASRAKTRPCPEFLVLEYRRAATEGTRLLAPLIPKAEGFDDFKYAVAAMAGFLGNWEFARFLDTLELYENQFHHPWFERPMSPNE